MIAPSTALLLAPVVLPAASGILSALLRRRPRLAQRAACAALCAGAAAGLAAAATVLLGAGPLADAGLRLALGPLGAVFLLAIGAVSAAGAVFGLRYHPQEVLGARAVLLQVFFGLASGSMALVVLASNAILFLAAWETMALSGFFLVQSDHDRAEVREAAFVYLAATHVGTLALFALFALLGRAAGSFDFSAMEGLPALPGAFPLALLGFGLKAGLFPLHFWLPGAHAAAPSHVSALMSGVLIKMGIYGLLRVVGLLDAPPAAWGALLLLLGAASAVLGVALALAQHDLKRLLAYHSVENIGIIAMGAGLALLGRARGEPGMVVLGLAGSVLHVLNHALFKSLLFLGAGAVHHATGTREIDLLGGLARPMRATAGLFLLGAAAISGLPPLNGFVSEWLVGLGLLDALRRPAGDLLAFAALGLPVLALVGGLAAACFAKVVGVVFLGVPRSQHAHRAHEPPASMLLPMAALAAGCAAIGLFPGALVAPLSRAAADFSRSDPGALAAVEAAGRAGEGAARISLVAAALLVFAALGWLLRRRRLAARRLEPDVETWGCGFSAPTARMQYTGSSFAEMLVRRFSGALRPRTRATRPAGPFPATASFRSEVPDAVLDLGIGPAARAYVWIATRAHILYLRLVQMQMLLILVALLAILAWGFLR